MLANVILDYFIEGGPIMWPIAIALIAALAIIFQRTLWWLALFWKTDPACLEQTLEAIAAGDLERGRQLTATSRDPFCRTVHDGLKNVDHSLLGAMQLHASDELARAEQLQWVLGTLITLAPLLGLLGTITGIMRSFSFVGDDQLAPTKVSGGIAEALIATACGLGIAILCLVPFNYFNRRLVVYRHRLERTINHVELLIQTSAQQRSRKNEFPRPRGEALDDVLAEAASSRPFE